MDFIAPLRVLCRAVWPPHTGKRVRSRRAPSYEARHRLNPAPPQPKPAPVVNRIELAPPANVVRGGYAAWETGAYSAHDLVAA
ncbi:hypothetical protein ACFOVU_23765 [Nocardiopsis sediminis]|uniref:Uncharacterized protein n=1 Tax=Nocardiopsis sediminis TaxID=1778267 RepID=A0ABV8FS78_9ACTN